MRDDDPEEARYRAIREEGAAAREREPEDLDAPRVAHLGRTLSIGAAVHATLGTDSRGAAHTDATTVARYPSTLPCRHCGRAIPVEPFVFETFELLSKQLKARGASPIDPVANRSDRPCCADCASRADKARAALEAEAHRTYLAARRRLLDSCRPDAVEASDWAVIRDHGGDVEIRDLRAKRSRRGSGSAV
jgi:hypothetical protein